MVPPGTSRSQWQPTRAPLRSRHTRMSADRSPQFWARAEIGTGSPFAASAGVAAQVTVAHGAVWQSVEQVLVPGWLVPQSLRATADTLNVVSWPGVHVNVIVVSKRASAPAATLFTM